MYRSCTLFLLTGTVLCITSEHLLVPTDKCSQPGSCHKLDITVQLLDAISQTSVTSQLPTGIIFTGDNSLFLGTITDVIIKEPTGIIFLPLQINFRATTDVFMQPIAVTINATLHIARPISAITTGLHRCIPIRPLLMLTSSEIDPITQTE